MEEAVRFWSSNIKAMLTQKFGKDKVGHIVIIFPFGHDVSCSWISDARRHDVVKLLRKLADHIESPNAKIIRPN
jgi:hypothetical protein